ncbi:IS30 family transposase [Corynebacterium diphtheriae]|uniref:IS30 family transposase n=1 Tax=Corynebacterium diphtheriae TaxID=1717 RepID=UPI000245A89D|nr:IS30 family transposase [Corynebacterium diphtheriae]AEX42349.1 transposase-like protein [Corynebacterium diphtheriae 31A]
MTQRLKSTMNRKISPLTWDQGQEMAKACEFEVATGVEVFFVDPHSPWQRPSNERMDRDIREYFPKGTNFSQASDDDVAEVETLLNNRLWVVLDGLTPRDVLCGVVHDASTALTRRGYKLSSRRLQHTA